MVTRMLLSISLCFLISSVCSLYIAHDVARWSSRDSETIGRDRNRLPSPVRFRDGALQTPDESGIENETRGCCERARAA